MEYIAYISGFTAATTTAFYNSENVFSIQVSCMQVMSLWLYSMVKMISRQLWFTHWQCLIINDWFFFFSRGVQYCSGSERFSLSPLSYKYSVTLTLTCRLVLSLSSSFTHSLWQHSCPPSLPRPTAVSLFFTNPNSPAQRPLYILIKASPLFCWSIKNNLAEGLVSMWVFAFLDVLLSFFFFFKCFKWSRQHNLVHTLKF